MIISNDKEYELTYRDYIKKTEAAVKAVSDSSLNNHDLIKDLLFVFAQFHAAVADKLFEKEEYNHPIITRFSQAELTLGTILLYSWKKKKKDPAPLYKLFLQYFQKLSAMELPGKLYYKAPEGFSFIDYCPEQFFNSAEKFFKEKHPETVFCIGIRNIGIISSAAAAAYLDDKGCKTHLLSIKVRGDFMNRSVSINPNYFIKLNSEENAFYAIVDDGGELNGSAINIITETLTSRQILINKIIILNNTDFKNLQ